MIRSAPSLPQCRWRLWLSIAGIIIGQVLPLLGPAQPNSPLAIFSTALTLYSVFVLAKVLYRKSDLKKSQAVSVPLLASLSH